MVNLAHKRGIADIFILKTTKNVQNFSLKYAFSLVILLSTTCCFPCVLRKDIYVTFQLLIYNSYIIVIFKYPCEMLITRNMGNAPGAKQFFSGYCNKQVPYGVWRSKFKKQRQIWTILEFYLAEEKMKFWTFFIVSD